MNEPFASIRLIVNDVDESLAFYIGLLGFVLQVRAGNAFASVTKGPMRLLLSSLTSSGATPMPDGCKQEPGGWTRILLTVHDLEAEVKRLQAANIRFHNDILKGVGGSQILMLDPSGNVIELFEPAEHSHDH